MKLAALIFLTGITLACCIGCGTPEPVAWENWQRWKELPAVWKVVSADYIQRKCPPHAGFITHACAERDYADGLCFIYAQTPEEEAPGWLKDHEQKHCRGYDHAAPIAMPDIRFR